MQFSRNVVQAEHFVLRRCSSSVAAFGLRGWIVAVLLMVLLPVGSAAMAQVPSESASSGAASIVQGHLQGRITVNPEVDSTQNYRGFEVMVLQQTQQGSVDTLGYAVTDRSGSFEADVFAPEKGIYSLIVRRRGSTLAATDYVVAEGDSARVTMELPVARRILIRSTENAAWTAYQNTVTLHQQALVRGLQDTTATNPMEQAMEGQIRQTAQMLWGMRDTYPGTLGAAQSAAESISLLDGWNDSLAVARAREIEPSNPRFIEVARVARRAEARRGGQAAALALLQEFQQKAATSSQRAALQAEIVRAHIDSLEQEQALAAAHALAEEYPDTPWADWAGRAEYEVENLLPGMPVPTFEGTTWTGEPFALGDLKGQPVVLEFYRPSNSLYQGQLSARKALYEATSPAGLNVVSVSLQPDTLLNEAFFEGRDLPGTHIVATQEMARALIEKYNIGALPTRILVDAEGNIVDRYVGTAFAALQEEAQRLIEDEAPSQ